MLTLHADGAESLWDELLPEEVRVLPDDLARLDELLSDRALLAPFAQRWERELAEAGRFAGRGRPSLAMESYVRLMVIKHRCGWGYETLMREVSDSIHLRRFCRLGLSERVPDESTVMLLWVVNRVTRELRAFLMGFRASREAAEGVPVPRGWLSVTIVRLITSVPPCG